MSRPQEIQQRVTAYGCCSLDALYQYVQSRIYGEDKCAEEKWRMFIYLRWAKAKMCDPCLTDREKLHIAKKVDCYCNPCGCPQPPEPTCGITPSFTVIDTVAFDDLPSEPNEGDAYYITSGDFTGRIATWQSGDDPQWVFTVVGVFNPVLETTDGQLWINVGNGPGPLFSPVTIELVAAPDTWLLSQDFPQTAQNRLLQLEGLGPNGWYAMWQGNESQLPLNVNLLGLPFTQVRARYILANECEYTSPVGTTIPDIDPDTGEPECGDIEIDLGEPVVNNSSFTIPVTIESIAGYPLGPVLVSINGEEAIPGVVPVVGLNTFGPYPLGQTVQITITNTVNSDCNVVLDPVVTECPSPTVEVEPFLDCDFQPEGPDGPTVPIWGRLVTVTPDPMYPIGSVVYFTPLLPDGVTATEISPNVYGCGPLNVDDDPGPMTIVIENEVNKDCNVELGPFEPGECPPETLFDCGGQQPCPESIAQGAAFCLSEETGFIDILEYVVPGGYVTIKNPNGDISVIDTSAISGIFVGSTDEDDNPIWGLYCIWPSDEFGNVVLIDPSETEQTQMGPVGGFSLSEQNAYWGQWSWAREYLCINGLWTGERITTPSLPNVTTINIGPEFSASANTSVLAIDLSNAGPLLSYLYVGGYSNLQEIILPSTHSITFLVIAGCYLPSSGVDALAMSLNQSLVVEVVISSFVFPSSVEPPTSASQAARQALYDNGSTLPAAWLTDLVL